LGGVGVTDMTAPSSVNDEVYPAFEWAASQISPGHPGPNPSSSLLNTSSPTGG
jgi:hypothetical protein